MSLRTKLVLASSLFIAGCYADPFADSAEGTVADLAALRSAPASPRLQSGHV